MSEISCEGVDLMLLTNNKVHWFVPTNVNLLASQTTVGCAVA